MDRRTAFKSLASLAVITFAGPVLAAEEGPKVIEEFDPEVPEKVRQVVRGIFNRRLPIAKKDVLSHERDAVDCGVFRLLRGDWVFFSTLYLGGCASNVELRDPSKKRLVVVITDERRSFGRIYVDLPAGVST